MIKEAFQISYEGKKIGESGDCCPYSYSMNVKKMAMTGALALATGMSAASTATGFLHAPPWLPPLLTAPFYTVPVNEFCYDGVCKSPANDRRDEPASVSADTEAIGPTP